MYKKPLFLDLSKKTAIKFVVLFGIVSLFADVTYEGARSIAGPYLAILGANAVVVGFVAGFGELIGYGLRLVSGFLADRTGRYWIITIVGYFCSLLAVPLLALADYWWMAATLLVIERMGKAIRTPARDAMLSHAGQKMGMGWGFGLHEALDQIGAILGPLLVAVVLYFKKSYQFSFAILLLPALLALIALMITRRLYPHPQNLAIKERELSLAAEGIASSFWIYLAGAALIAAGFADFPLIAYHFEKVAILPKIWIPIIYSCAMGVDAIAAPLLGRVYDRKGFSILIFTTIFACFFAPLVFLASSFTIIFLGIICWGVGMGAQESLMRAIVASMAPIDKRASAYGIFNAGYGVFWFLGSVTMGFLYDFSITALVIFSVVIQLVALPLFWWVMKIVK